MASHGFDPGNPNIWYQSPYLGLIPAGNGGGIAGNCYNHSPVGASYHSVTNFTHPNSYPPPQHFTQPNPYPPPQHNYYAPPPHHFTQPHSYPPPQHKPSATLINGHLLPLQFPCASQTQAQYYPSPHLQPSHPIAPQPLTTTPQIPSIPSYSTPHPNPNLRIHPPISSNSSHEPLVVHSHLWRARCKQVALESTAATGGVKKPSRFRLGTVLPCETGNSQKRNQLLMRKPKFQHLLGAITQDVKTGLRLHSSYVEQPETMVKLKGSGTLLSLPSQVDNPLKLGSLPPMTTPELVTATIAVHTPVGTSSPTVASVKGNVLRTSLRTNLNLNHTDVNLGFASEVGTESNGVTTSAITTSALVYSGMNNTSLNSLGGGSNFNGAGIYLQPKQAQTPNSSQDCDDNRHIGYEPSLVSQNDGTRVDWHLALDLVNTTLDYNPYKSRCCVVNVDDMYDTLHSIDTENSCKKRFYPDISIWTAVMCRYCKLGHFEKAKRELKDVMNRCSWSTMITNNRLLNGKFGEEIVCVDDSYEETQLESKRQLELILEKCLGYAMSPLDALYTMQKLEFKMDHQNLYQLLSSLSKLEGDLEDRVANTSRERMTDFSNILQLHSSIKAYEIDCSIALKFLLLLPFKPLQLRCLAAAQDELKGVGVSDMIVSIRKKTVSCAITLASSLSNDLLANGTVEIVQCFRNKMNDKLFGYHMEVIKLFKDFLNVTYDSDTEQHGLIQDDFCKEELVNQFFESGHFDEAKEVLYDIIKHSLDSIMIADNGLLDGNIDVESLFARDKYDEMQKNSGKVLVGMLEKWKSKVKAGIDKRLYLLLRTVCSTGTHSRSQLLLWFILFFELGNCETAIEPPSSCRQVLADISQVIQTSVSQVFTTIIFSHQYFPAALDKVLCDVVELYVMIYYTLNAGYLLHDDISALMGSVTSFLVDIYSHSGTWKHAYKMYNCVWNLGLIFGPRGHGKEAIDSFKRLLERVFLISLCFLLKVFDMEGQMKPDDELGNMWENICLSTGSAIIHELHAYFLSTELVQLEHEHQKCSAAIVFVLISVCQHFTDHKQEFEKMVRLVEIKCSNNSNLTETNEIWAAFANISWEEANLASEENEQPLFINVIFQDLDFSTYTDDNLDILFQGLGDNSLAALHCFYAPFLGMLNTNAAAFDNTMASLLISVVDYALVTSLNTLLIIGALLMSLTHVMDTLAAWFALFDIEIYRYINDQPSRCTAKNTGMKHLISQCNASCWTTGQILKEASRLEVKPIL